MTQNVWRTGQAGLAALVLLTALPGQAALSSDLSVEIIYIEQQPLRPPVLSNLVGWPEDDGRQGARLGIADNNTTGKFLRQNYQVQETIVETDGDVAEAARAALDGGAKLVVLNVPDGAVNLIADLPEAADDLIFNAGSADSALRDAECRANVLHTLPSRAMLADALMQFFTKRRWSSLFLIEGNRPGDAKFAEALRASANKFRLSIDHDKTWTEDADMRRNAAQEVPVFTQADAYDVVLVADEDHDFGHYVLYNTWLPRPVAGSTGIEAVAWSSVVEQWGAAQLQSRFVKQAERSMTSRDYAAWAAVRSVGEAVTRTKSAAVEDVRDYVLSDAFSLAAFKGAKMSFRNWNGQLRQPIPLVHPRAVVSLTPVEGFLHQVTELDTLGIDEPESQCTAMGRTTE